MAASFDVLPTAWAAHENREEERGAMRLYDLTCAHMAPGIRHTPTPTPNASSHWGTVQSVWLAPPTAPDKYDPGLHEEPGLLTCGRTECRCVGDAPVVPWPRSKARKHVCAGLRATLDKARMLADWWVTDVPIVTEKG